MTYFDSMRLPLSGGLRPAKNPVFRRDYGIFPIALRARGGKMPKVWAADAHVVLTHGLKAFPFEPF